VKKEAFQEKSPENVYSPDRQLKNKIKK